MNVCIVTATPKAEELMAYCARVSSPQNQENTATAPRLLKYCLDKGHWSVFEMAHMTVETVRSWIHYLQVRDADGVQLEHREVARKCKAIFAVQFPVCAEALGWLK